MTTRHHRWNGLTSEEITRRLDDVYSVEEGGLGPAFRRAQALSLEPEPFFRMSRHEKLLLRILRGTSDADIPFEGLRSLLGWLGFAERIRGSHHIFTRDGVEEILNLQPNGSSAKPYQVRQVRQVIVAYGLGGSDES
jgi:hypothetical protein